MRTAPTLAVLLVCASALIPSEAQVQPGKPREFNEFISTVSKSDLLKLRGNRQAEAAKDISKKIISAELNKDGTFRLAVDRVEPWQFPNDGASGWRVHAKNERIKEGSITLDLACWVYVRQDPAKILEKIRGGKDLLVTGTVTRSDITIIEGKPVLNVDLRASDLKEGK